ncbi:putative alpha-L-arabinofuranosidase C [Teratosphaeria destructans]|uniref:Alpha-L-arabinofuranosidase C n=1 Tax=Teratosphaeria destructans TaxID=418781 RepID=A0A9W7SJ60_9PEZI|nr:putative alpha-L-arabinofuranosidase C [Teratosphaeria destructans]
MANLAQSVNVIAPLVTTARGLVRQTTWWPLWLFARFMRGWTVGVHVRAGCYEGATEPAWLRGVAETPWLDVSAAVDGEGWVSVAVVNCHLQEGFEVEVVGVREGGEVQRFEVSGERWDVVNTEAEQNVGVREVEWDGRGKVVFPRQSLTLLRWRQ